MNEQTTETMSQTTQSAPETEKPTKEKKESLPVLAEERGVLIGKSLQEQYQYAQYIVTSGLFKEKFDTPSKVLVALQFVVSLGLDPIPGLKSCYVINGVPALYGDLPLALVLKSGKLKKMREWFFGKDGKEIPEDDLFTDAFGAACFVSRNEMDVQRRFTFDDADKAGLRSRSGSPWQKYPKRMLQCRARAWCLKDAFPEMLNSAPIAEYDYDILPESGGIEVQTPRKRESSLNDKFSRKPDIEVVSKEVE